MTSAGAKIAVLFEPDAELTSRLNNEKEFRFVEVPTEEGKQDAEEPEPGTTEPGGEGPNGGETPDYRNSLWSYFANLDFSYVLIKKYDVELGGYALYSSSHLSGYARTQGHPKMGLHLSARFLDGNLQTSISVNDVFNTDVGNRESLLDGIISKSDNIIDARYIRLSVRYSFNRKNLKRFENHQGSNADSGRL